MARYKLTIAYDGTDFCGWQKQFPHADAVSPTLARFHDDDPPALDASPRDSLSPPPPSSLQADVTDSTPAIDRPRTELRTVQAVVERAVRLVVKQPIVLLGASRTDSGVHARGQVCAFTTLDHPASPPSLPSPTLASDASTVNGPSPASTTHPHADTLNHERFGSGWPAERGTLPLIRALNSRLPADVLVRAAEAVPHHFDPISGAREKAYTYHIWNSSQRSLAHRRTTLHIWHPLDAARMHEVAQLLVGEHDFAAFAAAGHGRLTTIRTVFACDVQSQAVETPLASTGEAPAALITITIRGSGFLWNMVRIIAGTLVEAGKGKLAADDLRAALASGDRTLAGPTLPPHGLCLEWIKYEPHSIESHEPMSQ